MWETSKSNISNFMRMQLRIKIVLMFFICFAGGTVSSQPKTNIMIIVADDLGWNDVSFHGSDIRTPSIDNLTKEGIVLNRFYTCPVCSPTRAGILTGKYPNRFGLRYGVCAPASLSGLPPDEITIAEYLSENGYENRAVFGKWHLGHSHVKYHPLNQGFNYFYGHYNGAIDYFSRKRDAELDWHRNFESVYEEGYSTDLIGKDVIRYISGIENDSPFFAYVAFNAPHSPMQAKETDLLEYGFNPDKESADFIVGGQRAGEREKEKYGMEGRGNNLRQTFSGMVSSMDQSIGDIIKYLKAEGLYENTIIWFLSDNGGTNVFGGDNSPLRGYKHQEWEGGVKTVSVIKPQAKGKLISEINQVISYIDIFPTLASLINGKQIPQMDGSNVKEAFIGETLSDRYLFLGKNAVVSDSWKLVENQLFRIDKDLNETKDVSEKYVDKYIEMKQIAADFKRIEKGKYKTHPKGWIPPKNWKMPEK